MWDNRVKRVILITVLSLIGLVALIYEYGVIVSYKYYDLGTRINGHYVGAKDIDYADSLLYENPNEYALTIKFREDSDTMNGHDIDLKYSFREELEKIKNDQNPLFWPESFFRPEYKIEKKITYDHSKVVSFIEGLDSMQEKNMRQPKNPTIEQAEDGTVSAVSQDQGTVIEDTDGVIETVEKAVMNETSEIDIDAEGFYKTATYAVDSPRVQRCVDYCNKIASLKISYTYADTDISFTPQELYGTIDISPNYDASINMNSVVTMLMNFANLHDTYTKQRKFKTHNHDYITITNSDYGWELDQEAEATALYADLMHARDARRVPEFIHSGFTYDKKCDDIGGFYAEVDLDNQMMYLYKNHSMVLASDVVTGCINQGHGTPPGIYDVDYKASPAVLKGEDYESKVTYWMPFNGGIGFHDANWRGSFGGDIYVWGGSHGCVNMPYYNAEELFYQVEEGMPVIVY